MFVAAYVYYKCNQEQVDNTVEVGKDEAIRALANASSTLRTTSTQVLHHARRCYSSEEDVTTLTSTTEILIANGSEHCQDDFDIDSTDIMASMPTVIPGTFENQIRQQWIDAAFGKDFYSTDQYTPPRQGVGDAGIPSYVTFGATIPSGASEDGDKVGVTLSKIAIGLYVRRVEQGSEAQCAGVQSGSILIDINGLGLLGEPSRQALERLWQYDGLLQDDCRSGTDCTANDDRNHGPLAMRFYKDGKIYTALMFTSIPCGISWAPCGYFALVQKAYSFAEKAGVRRGCLVAAVNGRSIRDMDHEVAAAAIRDLFVGGKEIELTFCYTPAASRCGFFHRAANGSDMASKKMHSPKSKRVIASADGVEVRAHPVLWNYSKPPIDPQTRMREGGMSKLAERVVAGEVEAPTGFKKGNLQLLSQDSSEQVTRYVSSFSKCPPLPMDQLLKKWDLIDSFLYCVKIRQANFDEDQLFAMLAGSNDSSRLETLRSVMKADDAWKIADVFLLQWVSIMCHSNEDEESSGMDSDTSEIPAFINELMFQLVEMSRRDEDFCQRLHFILRSYTATLEGQRKRDDSEKTLLNLLQALERLRTAQKRLAIQLTNATSRVRFSSFDKADMENDLTTRSNDSDMVPTSESSTLYEGKATANKKSKSRFKIFRKKQIDVGNASDVNAGQLRSRHSTPNLPSINLEPTPVPPLMRNRTTSLSNLTSLSEFVTVPSILENMNRFLAELDGICDTIERSLLKSISQKIADWALQPWSDSKESELAKVTQGMRNGLRAIMASSDSPKPLVNPIESDEVLLSVDIEECYILPSAHFPLLLTFNVDSTERHHPLLQANAIPFARAEYLYRTKVEVVAIRGSASPNGSFEGMQKNTSAYIVQAAVAGNIKMSGRSVATDDTSKSHVWRRDATLTFETRSCWGPPLTLSLGVSTVSIGIDGVEQVADHDEKGNLHNASEIGHCWVDMKTLWDRIDKGNGLMPPQMISCQAQLWSLQSSGPFDQQGELINDMVPISERLELELRISNERFEVDAVENLSRKRMLLYKHDDDLRQEMFAIQFINVCDVLLKTSGLDLKLLTFRCIPVGSNRGFIEWIPGSVPLSEVCQPFPSGTFITSSSGECQNGSHVALHDGNDPLSEVAKAGLFKYQSLPHSPNKQSNHAQGQGQTREASLVNNPIQEFLRSTAYDSHSPYFIQRDVMDNYVKSCAGYCVLTYLLGVGDRHLDNLLLHQNGYFFHCDYSFILGNDPKKYLPMRITEQMIHGMGGRESDNYARFLSLAGATFVALRRHENVRLILSMVRLMMPSALPDVSVNQSPEQALSGVLERLRLDLSDEKAITYMEQLIEDGASSKLWIALDAMHSIGKRF